MREDRTLLIDYRLVGTGWAECNVLLGPKKITVSASYLRDALGQLAAAALLLRLGAPSARVSFEEEPGEYRWGFDWHRSPNGDIANLRVRIWSFPDLQEDQPDQNGQVVFDEVVETGAVFIAVVRMLDAVLAKYGEEGYLEKWDLYRFPKALHDELKRLVQEWPGIPSPDTA